MQEKLLLGGGFAALVFTVVFALAKGAKLETPSSESLIEIPLAKTDEGQQYGFAAGQGLDEFCIASGMGEVTISKNEEFNAIAPFTGEVKQIVTKPGCEPCHFYQSPFSNYALKLCGNAKTGSYSKGDVIATSKRMTFGLFEAIQNEPGASPVYEPKPPAVGATESQSYLRKVFPNNE
jgi:hypothetical protein